MKNRKKALKSKIDYNFFSIFARLEILKNGAYSLNRSNFIKIQIANPHKYKPIKIIGEPTK